MSQEKPSIINSFGLFRRWLKEQEFNEAETTALTRVWRLRNAEGFRGRLHPIIAHPARLALDLRRSEANARVIRGLRVEIESLREKDAGKKASLNMGLMANRIEKLTDKLSIYSDLMDHLFMPVGDDIV